MTAFNLELITDLPDQAYLRIDDRFDVAILRMPEGLELRVYPIGKNEPWMEPFATFCFEGDEIIAAEREMEERP